ncbi:MAG: replication initiation protein [Pseudomonadales bacterium]|nr:replication initiation protein [Pseudomonadales bacterium]
MSLDTAAKSQAISVNERYYQPGTALSRLLSEAPYLPRCSDNKTAALVRPREYAIRYPYMQINRQDMVSWLVFDLDHSNSLIWEDENFPAPNFVVSNRKNGHSHLFYAIVPVCTSENARSKPIAYMKAVYEAMAARLNADPAYSGPVAKTPGHPWWLTWEIHGTEYELGELADYVDLAITPPWSTGPDLDAVSHSRHCLLFEELRFYAYSVVNREKERGTFQSFMRLLEAYAYNKNDYRQRGFSMNLTVAQVKATVKSVARWTWDRYTGNSQCHRGVMNLDKNLPLKERQRLAAERTHQTRQKATESKIRAACHSLQEKGTKLTKVAVASATGLTRQTIAQYQYILDEANTPAPSNVILFEPVSGQSSDVNYAVHQISAPRRGSCVGLKKGQLDLLPGGGPADSCGPVNSTSDPPS